MRREFHGGLREVRGEGKRDAKIARQTVGESGEFSVAVVGSMSNAA